MSNPVTIHQFIRVFSQTISSATYRKAFHLIVGFLHGIYIKCQRTFFTDKDRQTCSESVTPNKFLPVGFETGGGLRSVAIEKTCKTTLCFILQVLTMATVSGKPLCRTPVCKRWSVLRRVGNVLLGTNSSGIVVVTFFRAKVLRMGGTPSDTNAFVRRV